MTVALEQAVMVTAIIGIPNVAICVRAWREERQERQAALTRVTPAFRSATARSPRLAVAPNVPRVLTRRAAPGDWHYPPDQPGRR